MLVEQKIKELGFDKLTEAHTNEAKSNVDAYIQEYKDSIKESIQSGEAAGTEEETPAPSASGDIEAQVQAQYLAELEDAGYTEDQFREEALSYYMEEAKLNALMESVTGKAAATDADIQKWYDENLKTQEEEVKSDPSQYELHLMNDVALYAPEGIVRVKQILLKVDEGKSETAQNLYGEEKVEEAFDVLAREFTKIKPKADEVLKKAKGKTDFDKLVDQYNEDEGMKEEPYKTEGYTVVPGSTTYMKEFTDAALKLKKTGDTSGLVKTVYGYHILKNVGTVIPGPVALETVKEKIREIVVAENQDAAWEKQQEDWKNAGKITLYQDRLADEGTPAETPDEETSGDTPGEEAPETLEEDTPEETVPAE